MDSRARSGPGRDRRGDWRVFLPLLDRLLVGDWEAPAAQLNAPGFPRERFLAFVEAEFLGPTLLWHLERHGVASRFPSWWLLSLAGARAWQAHRQDVLLRALAPLAAAFEEAGVSLLVLKGVALAQRFYDLDAARRTQDLDLLVREAQLPAAQAVLQCQGYARVQRPLAPGFLARRLEHATAWTRDTVEVDLHHRLRAWPGARIDLETMHRQALAVPLSRSRKADRPLRIPSDEHALLLLVLGMAGDLAQGRLRALALLDLQRLLAVLDERLDWAAWFEARRQERVLGLCLGVWELARGLLPASLRAPCAEQAAAQVAEWAAERVAEQRAGETAPTSDGSSVEHLLRIAVPDPNSLAPRRWFMGRQEGSATAYLAWWLLGGPFRGGGIPDWWQRR